MSPAQSRFAALAKEEKKERNRRTVNSKRFRHQADRATVPLEAILSCYKMCYLLGGVWCKVEVFFPLSRIQILALTLPDTVALFRSPLFFSCDGRSTEGHVVRTVAVTGMTLPLTPFLASIFSRHDCLETFVVDSFDVKNTS